MAKTITLLQEHEVEISEEFESLSNEDLLKQINGSYDGLGKTIVLLGEYQHTILHKIDGEEVRIDGGVIGTDGSEILLEGLE